MSSISVKNGGETAADHAITEAFGFTRREKQVFALLLRGKDNGRIARELQISRSAVKACSRSLMRKLSASNCDDIMQKTRQWDLAVSRLTGIEPP